MTACNVRWHLEADAKEDDVIYMTSEAKFIASMFGFGDEESQQENWHKLTYKIEEDQLVTREAKIFWKVLLETRANKIPAVDLPMFSSLVRAELGGKWDASIAVACLPVGAASLSHNPNFYAKQVLEQHVGRLYKNAVADMGERGGGVELVQRLQKALDDIKKGNAQSFDASIIYGMPDSVGEFYTTMEERLAAQEAGIEAVKTGYPSLDDRVAFGAGHLVVVGGRASVGKTTFINNVMANMMLAGKRVVFFSLEMKRVEIVQNLTAIVGAVSYEGMSRVDLSSEEWDRVAQAGRELYRSSCVIYEDGQLTIDEIELKLIAAERKLGGVDAVFIDHMHIIRGDSKKTMRENMVQITAKLKAMAKTYKVPVVCLAQMNRDADKRNDKRPIMSDLKESGSIEQDADTVLFVYRDSLYASTNTGDTSSDDYGAGLYSNSQKPEKSASPFTEIICRKNRHGTHPFFIVTLTVNPETKKMIQA
jgi:replicative DNA helicase